MKKIIKLFVLVAAAAMTLASCQKNEITGPVKKEVNFTIKADMAETKTAITDNGDGTYRPTWEGGDKIGVLFALEENAKAVDFENTAGAGEVATFEGKHAFTVEEGADEVYGNLYAFYPSSAFDKIYSDGGVRLDLENTQYPTSTSFDPSCDLLIAKPCYYMAEATGEAAEVLIDDMYFARMMSVLKINLNSEFLTNETVKSVSFDADGVDFTGAMKFNLETGEFVGNQSASSQDLSEVKAVYSEEDPIAVAGDKNSAYFVVAPVTIPFGTTLTFTIETENYDIVKTVSAPSDMVMPAGNIAVINLNIKEDDCVAKTESDFSGTYAILTKRTTGGFWYMTNDLGTASTKRFTAEEAGGTLPEEGVTLGASKLWEVSKLGEYYTVKSIGAEKYITWTSGNSANLGDEGILFTITMTDEGFYNLSYAASDATRYLSLNQTSGSDYFALYKDGQKKDLALIRAEVGEEPSTLSVIAPGQMSADGGKGSFTYILTNPKDGIQLSAITEATWITDITVGDENVAYTVSPNTSEDVRESVITLTYGDLTESVKITQAGKAPETGGQVEAQETLTFSSRYSSNTVLKGQTVQATNFNVSFAGDGTSAQYYTNGTAVRAYAKNTFTVSSNNTIVKVVITFGSSDGSNTITTDIGSYQNGTWTGSSKSVKFTVGGASGHRRISAITVHYLNSTSGDGNEGGETPDPTPEPEPSVKTYTLTIDASSFNATSYAANNNEKTSTATASDGSTMDVKWTSYQVMKQSSAMQWQKNAGYIYNSTDLGTITDITITSSAGTFTKYINTAQKPTSNGTGGYFHIKVGGATGTASEIVIKFTK